MAVTLFISDLHLSDTTPAIEQGLCRFVEREILTSALDVERLYLLGDIFEAWIGDDDDAPLVARIRELLRKVTDHGTAVYITRGNRDFLLGEAFAQATGATLLDDATVHTVAGQATLLMHGDTLCTDDVDYQRFRVMAHDPNWQAGMLAKPLAERRALAQQLRAMSVDAASNKAEDIMDVNANAVRDAMSLHAVRCLIHGHTHRPKRHALAEGERLVLGDWTDSRGWCIRATDSDLTLESFTL